MEVMAVATSQGHSTHHNHGHAHDYGHVPPWAGWVFLAFAFAEFVALRFFERGDVAYALVRADCLDNLIDGTGTLGIVLLERILRSSRRHFLECYTRKLLSLVVGASNPVIYGLTLYAMISSPNGAAPTAPGEFIPLVILGGLSIEVNLICHGGGHAGFDAHLVTDMMRGAASIAIACLDGLGHSESAAVMIITFGAMIAAVTWEHPPNFFQCSCVEKE